MKRGVRQLRISSGAAMTVRPCNDVSDGSHQLHGGADEAEEGQVHDRHQHGQAGRQLVAAVPGCRVHPAVIRCIQGSREARLAGLQEQCLYCYAFRISGLRMFYSHGPGWSSTGHHCEAASA